MRKKSTTFIWNAGTMPTSVSADGVLEGWQALGRDCHLRIRTCGTDRFCRTLVWFYPHSSTSPIDRKNQNQALWGRDRIGIEISPNAPKAVNSSASGAIDIAHNSKSFDTRIALQSPQTLRGTGYWGIICRGSVWHRVAQ